MSFKPSSAQLELISNAARDLKKADPCNGERGRIVARLAETLNLTNVVISGNRKT